VKYLPRWFDLVPTRLVNHQAEACILEMLLKDLALGRLKRRGRRIDSSADLTHVQQYNQLEPGVETSRVTLQAMLAVALEWAQWHRRLECHEERCAAERPSDSERAVLQNETDRDG
jgi:hypothetical protein